MRQDLNPTLEDKERLHALKTVARAAFAAQYEALDDSRFERLWPNAVRQAESEILNRLVASVIFEKMVPLHVTPSELGPAGSPPRKTVSFATDAGEISIALKSSFAFARTRIQDQFTLRRSSDNTVERSGNPLAFFDLTTPAITRYRPHPSRITLTRNAVRNSLENLTCGIFAKLLQRELPPNPEASRTELIRYEQLVTTGHPIHPLTKYRSNLSIGDSIDIAPEYGNRVKIGFVAVRREYLRSNTLDPEGFQGWLDPSLRSRLLEKLRDDGHSGPYGLLPVHQWQYDRWLPRFFAEDIARSDVVLLENDSISADPTLSLRTLLVTGLEDEFYLKLPVNLQTTSYLRSVSPNATQNGVDLSRIFRTLRQRHPTFRREAHFLLETEGAFYSRIPPEAMTPSDIAMSKHLSYVVRESPRDFLEPDEIPIVTIALVDQNRKTDRPVIHDLIRKHTESLGETDLTRGALSWFGTFLRISLPGLLTLLSRYGIGFEAHMQNTLTVVNRATGTPTRILLRDFGGIRVDRDRLGHAGFAPEFFPTSVTIRDSMDEVTNKLYYAFFQSTLGELVAELCSTYGSRELDYWGLVYERSRQVFASLRATHPEPRWIEEDFEKFVAQEWKFKSLLSMSLIEPDGGYVYTEIENPLHTIHRSQPEPEPLGSFSPGSRTTTAQDQL